MTNENKPPVNQKVFDDWWNGLAELEARAMTPEKISPASRQLLNVVEAMWQNAEKECAEIEARTIERCAQVADDCAKDWDGMETKYFSLTGAARHIAAHIRALKDEPNESA